MSSSQTIALMPAEQYAVEAARRESAYPQIWEVLDAVKDPEIPVLSIWELGILRGLEMHGDGTVNFCPYGIHDKSCLFGTG